MGALCGSCEETVPLGIVLGVDWYVCKRVLLVKLKTISCEGCNTSFTYKVTSGPLKRFCSKECWYTTWYSNNKERIQKNNLAH